MEITQILPYYDPFDTDIDRDPYPVWKKLRDEAPAYYNERYRFYALSRHADVAAGLSDWRKFRSGRGTTLDAILSGFEAPPGLILFEDPPAHDVHRRMLAGVFTPRRMAAIEPLARQFAVAVLDPLIGSGRFDFIEHLGSWMPMRTIGALLGIPESDQAVFRDNTDKLLSVKKVKSKEAATDVMKPNFRLIADYVDYRTKHPANDLMTDLINAEVTDPDGRLRRLTHSEVLTYIGLIMSAGSETTTRLIGFTGQLLSDHPAARRQIATDPTLLPNAIEEVLRYEAPSPVQARYVATDVEYYGQKMPAGSTMLLINGSANRDERRHDDPDRFDIRRKASHLSFGQGLHFCLGAALARMEARVAVEEVLKRWTDWEVDYDNAVRAHTSSVRGWAKLPVTTG